MLRFLSVLEFLSAALLCAGAAILFANAKFCWFNHTSCGMVEPLIAVFAVLVAVPMGAAGALHWRRKRLAGFVALVPSVAIVVFLFGQARLWW